MGCMNFENDILDGKEVEKEFANILLNNNFSDIKFNNDYKYDIIGKLNDAEHTFEIKNDETAITTRNFGIEFHSRGKNSGIATTIAENWVHKIDNKFYAIRTSKLKELIKNKKYDRIGVGGDDGSNTKLYLFNMKNNAKDWIILSDKNSKFI